MTRPWRAVVGGPDGSEHPLLMTGRGSLLGPDTARRTAWWEMRLECGHQVERTVRYPPRSTPVPYRRRRSLDDALPPPRRVRCEQCPRKVAP